MVGRHGDRSTERSGRGQLLLAGSIIIALILVGLTVLLNSVVFTENVAGGSSVEVTGDINEFNREMRRNARSLTIRVSHARPYTDIGNIEDNLRRNASNYSRVLAESYADTGSVFVNVSFEGTQTEGRRVLLEKEGGFENPTGVADWNAFAGTTRSLGWFVMTLDMANVSRSDRLRVKVENTTGANFVMTLQKSAGGKLLVNSTVDGTHTSNVTCEPSGGYVLLDVVDGTGADGGCTFNGTSSIDGPFETLRFENGDAVRGRFAFVVNGTNPGITVATCTAAPDPCLAKALWEIELTTRYETTELAYENTQIVSVYEGS